VAESIELRTELDLVLLAIVLASSLTFNLGDLLFDCSVVIDSFRLEEEVELVGVDVVSRLVDFA